MHARIPLVRGKQLSDVFAYYAETEITLETFLKDVQILAARLPKRAHVLNLCSDRYHFAVGFAAALARRQISLLPPNHAPATVEQLRQTYPDLYCLSENDKRGLSLPHVIFQRESQGSEPKVPDLPAFAAEQVAAIVFTSGSTGQPLAYAKSWRSLTLGARAAVDRFRLDDLPGLGLLATVPVQHMYGLESSALLALQSSARLHAGRPFFPADVHAAITNMPGPRGLITTPVHLRALLETDGNLPGLDFILCATAPLDEQLAARAEQRFGAPLYEIYGCTEAGQVASRRPVETRTWLPFSDVRLRQAQNATWALGGHIENDTVLNDHIELKADGQFLLHGRLADLINIAGKRTSLAHLNHQLTTIPGVQDGVFVMPQESGAAQTRLTAFVVAPNVDAETILQALRLRVDPVFLPRPLCFVSALPRNATGKLPHSVLSELQQAHAVNEN